jgi:hypothetical protein
LDGEWEFEGSSINAIVEYYVRQLDLDTCLTEPTKRMNRPR